MDVNIYNGYGNPYFEHGGQGKHNKFFRVENELEDAVNKALIPILDLYNLDELAAVTTYISSYGNEMFSDYLDSRKHEPNNSNEWDTLVAGRLSEVALNCYKVAKEVANKIVKPYFDTLSYYEVVALAAYISANFQGIFATYMLMRSMLEQANKHGRSESAEKFTDRLDTQRSKLGLPPFENDWPGIEYMTDNVLENAIHNGYTQNDTEEFENGN